MGRLFERIKETIQKLTPSRAVPEIPAPVPGDEEVKDLYEPVDIEREVSGYLDQAAIVNLLRDSAQKRVLVHMRYNNQWRHVEGYSFRPGKHGLFYFGHCLIHNDTHSFYVHRVQGLQQTQIPYSPRWTIEL